MMLHTIIIYQTNICATLRNSCQLYRSRCCPSHRYKCGKTAEKTLQAGIGPHTYTKLSKHDEQPSISFTDFYCVFPSLLSKLKMIYSQNFLDVKNVPWNHQPSLLTCLVVVMVGGMMVCLVGDHSHGDGWEVRSMSASPGHHGPDHPAVHS